MENSAIVPINVENSLADVQSLMKLVIAMKDSMFKEDVDYGVIPNTNNKPVLLLPGMEKLLRALSLRPEYVPVTKIEDFDKPLFFYRYECRLIDTNTGRCLSTAIGSANSKEAKWGYRWVPEHLIPVGVDPASLKVRSSSVSEPQFAIDKSETSGEWGKPAAYWQRFKDAIANGTARKETRQSKKGNDYSAWVIEDRLYRVENDDIFDQINTIDKIAQKRSLSSAIKGAANVSEFFTVDLDDMSINQGGDIIEGTFTVEAPESSKTGAKSNGNASQGANTQKGTQKPENGKSDSKDIHWAKDDESVTKFYAWVRSNLSEKLQDSEVLEALKVEQMSDFEGEKEAAMAHVIAHFNGYDEEQAAAFVDGMEKFTPDWKDDMKTRLALIILENDGFDLEKTQAEDF